MGRKFSMFRSAKAQVGEVCTHNRYLAVTSSPALLELCQKIAAEPDGNKRGELKKGLPVVTWQSYFPSKRLAKEAEPSGLFMLDIDHVDDPWKLYSERMCNSDIKRELGIVFIGKTASCHGLRIVAKCRPGLKTIADCQRWLASNLKVDYDGVCKDWARCSFLVHDSYTYYMDAQGIWGTPEEGEVYENELAPKVATFDEGIPIDMDYDHAAEILGLTPSEEEENDGDEAEEEEKTEKEPKKAAKEEPKEVVDQREGLFGGTTEYKGIPLADIAKEWLAYATLSFEGSVNTWLILGFDPIMTDVYGSEEMKAPNKFFDYYEDDTIFDMLKTILDDIPDTCLTEYFPAAADIVRNQMAYDLVIGGVDPAEIAHNCAEALRDEIM